MWDLPDIFRCLSAFRGFGRSFRLLRMLVASCLNEAEFLHAFSKKVGQFLTIVRLRKGLAALPTAYGVRIRKANTIGNILMCQSALFPCFSQAVVGDPLFPV